MNAIKWGLLVIFAVMMIGVVSADVYTNVSSSRSVTTKGPYDILVSLGIEYVVTPLDAAYLWYNFISVGLLFGCAGLASKRNTGSVALLIPVISGLCIWFGWMHSPDPVMTVGVLCFSTIIAAAIYMNDQLHMNFGIGGPGSKAMNIIFYMLILQAVVGFVNTSAIWGDNNIGVKSSQYQNVDLQAEVTTLSNSGNLLGTALSSATIILDIAISTVKVFISVLVSIFLFGAALILIFPFLNTPIVVLFLSIVTVILDYLFIKMMADIFYFKLPGVDDL